METLMLAVALGVCQVPEPPQAPPVTPIPPQAPPVVIFPPQAPKLVPVAPAPVKAVAKVLNFGTHNCIHCLVFKPIFEKWAERYKGSSKFEYIDANVNQEFAKRHGVVSYPTIIIDNGSEVIKFIGAPSEEQFENAVGIKTKLDYSEALGLIKTGKSFILAVGEERRSMSSFGGLPVYTCTNPPPETPAGHYKCFLEGGLPKWQKQ